VPDIDGIFPGFKAGDFAVIYGPQTVTSMVSQLCVRAQLPKEYGGLEGKVVFIDAAASASLSNIPHAMFANLTKMRAYTAYRLTSIMSDQLEKAVVASDAKLVVISDIAGPFLSDNVDDQEAKAVYSQIMSYLVGFAKKHRIIVVTTYLPHEGNRRNSMLQDITTAKAGTVLRFTKTPYTSEVELEKHPTYMLGVAEFNPEVKTLADFATTPAKPVSALSYRIL
jgi:RecA/RadA recombinase